MAAHRIPEVHLWRVDPNLRNSDVDQGFYRPFLTTYSGYEAPHPTTPGCNSVSSDIEHHSHNTLDSTVPAYQCCMG